jgi:hypothetical protein
LAFTHDEGGLLSQKERARRPARGNEEGGHSTKNDDSPLVCNESWKQHRLTFDEKQIQVIETVYKKTDPS